ncbi:unnamed protein product [Symbiodinium sp. CCMP2592]|nr:unnamed protein product [Symbiodinium sp. CCMP2592]
MLSLACLCLLVLKLAEGTGTCETPGSRCQGNDTTGLLQLQSHQGRLVGLEVVQGCCVVVDASNMSKPVLARTEMGTSPECYSNASEAQDPAGYIRYFTRGCPDDLVENILEGLKADAGTAGVEDADVEEAVPGQPEAPSLALTMAGSSVERNAASGYYVFESFQGTWPEPDPAKITYQSSYKGTVSTGGIGYTPYRCLTPQLFGAIWRSPTFPVTSAVGTTMQFYIYVTANTVGSAIVGFDTDPLMSGTKQLLIYKSYYNGVPHLYMQFRDRTNWGNWNVVGGQAVYQLSALQTQWLRVLIQVVSTTEVVARLYDSSESRRMTLMADFASVGRTISDSGTAYLYLYYPYHVYLDHMATCQAIILKELPTDAGQCRSAQTPFRDECILGVSYICTPSNAAPLPLGTTQISCESSDGYTFSFETEVKDTEPPILSKSFADVIEVTTCGQLAQVTFAVEASDNCDTVTPTCIPPSGSLFPVGATNVTCTAQDSAGNAATMTFQVMVAGDTTPPESPVVSPVNPTGDAGSCGDSAEVIFDATFTDECQPVSVLCTPSSGSSFQLGSTPVECTAADPSGNTVTVSFDVTVTGGDSVAPVITQLADIDDVTTCGETAQVTFVVEASDNCDTVTPTCTPPSGSLFPVGTTNVTCTAQDSAGNAATPMTFQVMVTGDTTPPAFDPTLVNKTADAGCGDSAQVSFEAVATDACGPPQVSCTPTSLSLFPVGSTTVQCTARDASGNEATENFVVTVLKGVEPPSFGPTSDVEVHSPYCKAMRVQFDVPVNGGCGHGAECFPASGSIFRLGKTPVTCTASNDAGSAETTFNVNVYCDPPHPPRYRHRWGLQLPHFEGGGCNSSLAKAPEGVAKSGAESDDVRKSLPQGSEVRQVPAHVQHYTAQEATIRFNEPVYLMAIREATLFQLDPNNGPERYDEVAKLPLRPHGWLQVMPRPWACPVWWQSCLQDLEGGTGTWCCQQWTSVVQSEGGASRLPMSRAEGSQIKAPRTPSEACFWRSIRVMRTAVQ